MKKTKFAKDTVKYTAKLARMHLSEKQAEVLSGQLANILTYIDKLNRLDTDKIEPTSYVLTAKNVFREDELKPSLESKQALKTAPKQKNDFFTVPKIIE